MPRAWTAPQRGVVAGLLGAIAVLLLIRLAVRSTTIPDPPPPEGPRAGEVENRIDPNQADWHSLAALPNIGPKRAQDIIAYRDQFVRDHPGQIAFPTRDDLLRIRGVGAATVAQLDRFLIFPAAMRPASSPAN